MSLEALAALAAADPEAPFLFAPSGLDWRWLGASVAVERVAALTQCLAALPAGARVVFQDDLSADALLLDLAVTASGLVACPLRGAPSSRLGDTRVVWAESGTEIAARPDGGKIVVLERPFRFATRGGERASTRTQPLRVAPGWVVVDGVDGVDRVDRVGEVALEAVARAASSLPIPLPVRTARHVTVLSVPLSEALGRLHLSWGLSVGAAWVAAPGEDPAAAARWARPTALAGPLAALEAQRSAWQGGRPRWQRLELWLHAAADVPREGARDYWRERGVTLLEAPAFS